MKYYFFIIIFVSLNSFAITQDCEEKPEISKLAVPNCLKDEFLPESDSGKDFCRDCGDQFNKNYTGEIPNDKKSIQEHFLKTAANEFKKTISNNLVEAVKLAALPRTGAQFTLAQNSCNLSKIEINDSNCKSPSAVKLLKDSSILSSLNKQMAGELAKILSTDPQFTPKESLLKRESPLCFIPESHLLYLTSSTIDEAFDTKLINAFRSLDKDSIKSIKDLFRNPEIKANYKGNLSELRDSIKSHPFLSEIFKSPDSVINFFKNIKEPLNNDSFKAHLYSKESAENIDKKLATNCETSLKQFKEAICNKSFEEGHLNLDPLNNISKLSDETFTPADGDLATTDDLIKSNIKFVKFCSREPSSEKTPNLTLLTKGIASGIDAELQKLPYESYRVNKYKNDIGNLNTNLCEMNKDKCVEGTFSCSLFQKYQKMLDKNSVDYRLANSSNDEVKQLLRSMIGNPTDTDPKTKEILVAHGIIPKDDGTFVKQPDIPERQPEYFAKAAANPQPTQLAQAQFKAPAAQPDRTPASTAFNDQGYNNASTQQEASSNYTMPDFSDITRNNEELQDIQNEIRRRLGDMGSAPTKTQAQKAIRDSFASKGRTLSPQQEESFATQMTAPAPTSTLPALNREIAAATTPVNRAAVSNTDTQAEKWKKGQMNNALMGMAGAQGTSTDQIIASANASQDKELTKVALNIAEDPRVTLSDIFNNKLKQNDSETQLLKVLLKNKNNFVLQVKSMNFKVIFDEKQNFNVLLESGDKQEAERIRPQLEMFLKKLRA